ncbi:MAG TPA: right-handed parallel beta-helix repeat-containing protein [Solimonas sp.]|nr:right-handed parallel beta-helix repeat-containing protein [Solimonas sp.]
MMDPQRGITGRFLGALVLLLCASSFPASAQTELDVREFGALGNGSADDAPAIQRALDAAAGRKAIVRLPAGTYRIGQTLLPPDAVEVRGASAASSILLGASLDRPIVDVSGRRQVTFRSLTLTFRSRDYDRKGASAALVGGARKDSGPATDISIIDCVVSDTPKQGIIGNGSVRGGGPLRWRIAGSRFTNIGRGGAIFLSGDGIIVEDTVFERTGDDAIAFLLSTRNSVARRNTIRDAGVLLDQGSGIKVHGNDNLIEDNDIQGFVNAGINLKKGNPKDATAPTNNRIERNRIARPIDLPRKANQAGIQINDAAGGVLIRDNRLDVSSAQRNYDGIRIETSPLAEIRIEGNQIDAALASAPGMVAVRVLSSVSLLEIRGNSFRVLGDGVLLRTHRKGGRVLVADNKFLSAGEHPIVSLPKASAGLKQLVVRGNSLQDRQRGPLLSLADRPIDELDESGNTGGEAVRKGEGLKGIGRRLQSR